MYVKNKMTAHLLAKQTAPTLNMKNIEISSPINESVPAIVEEIPMKFKGPSVIHYDSPPATRNIGTNYNRSRCNVGASSSISSYSS